MAKKTEPKPNAKAKTKTVGRPQRQPKEDFNQATFRVMQEIVRRTEN